jgi:hypothetical protein
LETNHLGKKIIEKLQTGIRTDELLESLLNYLEVNLELLKLDAHEGISRVLSKIAEFVVLVILGTLLLIFGSIAVALFINFFFDTKPYVGFTAVSLFYVFLLLLYYLFAKKATDENLSKVVENAVENVKFPHSNKENDEK